MKNNFNKLNITLRVDLDNDILVNKNHSIIYAPHMNLEIFGSNIAEHLLAKKTYTNNDSFPNKIYVILCNTIFFRVS